MEANTTQRSSKLGQGMKGAFKNMMLGVNTAIPGFVLSFNASNQTAKIQVSIQMLDADGKWLNWSPLIVVPVHFAGGDAFVIEHQVDAGDEGLVIFSQRCIDGWFEAGGVARQTEVRQFDSDDAFFIPGFRSKPNVISGFSNDGVKLRNKAGDKFAWLKSDGTLEISANMVVTGTASFTGAVTSATSFAAPSIVVDGIEAAGHTHTAGTPPGDTGVMK